MRPDPHMLTPRPSDRLTVRPSDRQGIALLDALVALTILSGSALSLTAVLRQAVQAQTALSHEEELLDNADRLLAAMTLLGAGDLDQRLGSRTLGAFVTTVQRPERGLYRIAIAEGDSPGRILLVTVVHRAPPEPR